MLPLRISGTILLRAHASQRNGIHKFEMTWIEAKREVNLPPRHRFPVAAVSEVILHVAAPDIKIRIEVRKLAENLPRALRHDVGEHV